VGHFLRTVLRGTWIQLHQTWTGHRATIDPHKFISEFGYLAAFPNAGVSKSSDVENNTKFRTFWPLWKLGEVWVISLDQLMKHYLRPNLRNTFYGRSLGGCGKPFIDKPENVAIAIHRNLRPPAAAPESSSAWIMTPMPSLKSLNLSAAILWRFYFWYATLRCDLDLWPCDLDPWPLSWTFVVCRLCRGQSIPDLSAVEQSAAELLRFECLTLWPWTCFTCSAMLWYNFHKA